MVEAWYVRERQIVKQLLINKHIEFWCYRGRRYWYLQYASKYLHREDSGPAYENINTGRCEWWKQGKCVRATKCNGD